MRTIRISLSVLLFTLAISAAAEAASRVYVVHGVPGEARGGEGEA